MAFPCPTASSTATDSYADHSLLRRLIRRRLFASAHTVLRRIITHAPLRVSHGALRRAASLGLDVDYGSLLRRLNITRQAYKVLSLYKGTIKRVAFFDPSVINNMIICYSRLGSSDLAKAQLSRMMKFGSLPCEPAWRSLVHAMCTEGKYREAAHLFFPMVRSGILLGAPEYNLLVHGLCAIGNSNLGYVVSDIMFMSGIRPTLPLYKSLVYGFCKEERFLEAEQVIDSMRSYQFCPLEKMCTAVIYGFCKEGNMKAALRIFNASVKHSSYTYNTLIYGFLNVGEVNTGWNLLRKIEPNNVSYNMFINWYCKNGKVETAMQLFDLLGGSALAPSLHCYTVMISALCKENRFSDADNLLDSFMRSGLVPDHVMFVSLLKYYPKDFVEAFVSHVFHVVIEGDLGFNISNFLSMFHEGKDEELVKICALIYDNVIKSGIFHAEIVLSILVGILCAEGKTHLANLIMDKMADHGYKATLSNYNFLLRCLYKENNVMEAESLISTMRKRNVIPDPDTFLIIVDAYCKSNDIDAALQVSYQMIQDHLKPKVAIYDSIICSLCNNGRVKKAERIFRRMIAEGVKPDEVVCTNLISGYSKQGRIGSVFRLGTEMQQYGLHPSPHIYGSVINLLLKRNRITAASGFLCEMLKNGFTLDTVSYTIMINQFCRKGDFSSALYLTMLMDNNKVEPDLVTYASLITGICRNIHRKLARQPSEKEKYMFLSYVTQPIGNLIILNPRILPLYTEKKIVLAYSLMQHMISRGLTPDLYIYNALLSGYCRAKILSQAGDLLERMRKDGVTPNEVTFTILIDGYRRLGQIDGAIQLFNQMKECGCSPDRATYNALIKALCSSKRAFVAMSVICTMRKRDLKPSKLSFERIIYCLGDSGEVALKLIELMISCDFVPSSKLCNWLLQILVQESKMLEANYLFDIMLKSGKAFDKSTKIGEGTF